MSDKRNESTPRRVRRWKDVTGTVTTAVVLASALALGVSASAASAAGGKSSGVAAAKAVVAAHTGPVNQFVAPGPAVNGKRLKGKSIWFVELGGSGSFVDDAQALQQPTEALGMKLQVCDGNYVPATWSACITQAVNAGAAGIVTDSFSPEAVAPAVAYAKKHKVPIVVGSEPGRNTPLEQFMPFTDGPGEARVAVDWMIAHSDGKANILAVTTEGDPGTQADTTAAVRELKKNCPSCGWVDALSTSSDFSTVWPTAVSAALLKHPSLTIAYAQFDPDVPYLTQGMNSAGRSLPYVGMNAVLAQMESVKSHGSELADVGSNANYSSWIVVDRLIRMILHKPAPTHVYFPIRVFDSTNVSRLTMTQSASTSGQWYGPTTSYKNGFKKLWGLA